MLLPPRIWKNVRQQNLLVWGVACCCAGTASNGLAQTNAAAPPVAAKPGVAKDKGDPDASRNFILIPPHGEDWTRHFQAGAVMAFGISAKFHETGNFAVNHDPGTYDDGYVRTDDTGSAGGATSYWGYENASQYNAAAQTISFHSVTAFNATGAAKANGDPSFGLDLAYGDDYIYCKPAHMRIGWELGLNFLPIDVKDDSTLTGSATQFTYNYDTGGIVVPGTPYHGGPSGEGPLLSATSKSSSFVNLPNQTITGSRSLNMDLFAFRLGPSFFWDISQNLGLSFGGGPVIGCVTGDYNYDENITINGVTSHNKGSFGNTEFVYGAYVNAMLKYHIVDNGRNAYLFLGAQYTPMSTAHFSNGGRSADLDLSGQVYISAGLGWPF
ncbi:MAG TPA: hypothetical protein VG347_10995 [Verrucomicrobiae bacterium]|nr:hypothetical protein [Verrucomicrobiae bacterium]